MEDLVRIRVALNDGKIGRDAMNLAPKKELQTYAEWLQREFDGQSDDERHSVTVLHDDHSGFVAIEPVQERASVRVLRADAESARTLARTREPTPRGTRAMDVFRPLAPNASRKEDVFFQTHPTHALDAHSRNA